MSVYVEEVVRGRTVGYAIDTHAPPPLDVSDPATFDRWCASPKHDGRTLEEFAADGGRPCSPPNNIDRMCR